MTPKSRVALALVALAAVPVAFGAAPETARPSAPASPGAAPEVAAKALAEFMAPCQERLEVLATYGYRPRSLVATLPDPVDSRFRREFDLLLTAMRRALDSRYVQDRHCLPWSPSGAAAGSPPFHRSLPGVILYRRDPSGADPGEILTLYLVGEVPSWGIQTEALRLALDLVVDGPPASLGPVPPPATVDVLAPTFSGSTHSLAVTLAEWRDHRRRHGLPAPPYRIVSGTATSPSNREVLDRALGSGYTYRTTATESDLLWSCLWDRFVPQRLGLRTSLTAEPGGTSAGRRHDVALLVETSPYGAGFPSEGLHVIPFPMHVSQLRAEYEKNRAEGKSGAGNGAPELWQRLPSLDLDLTQSAETLDTIPVFDSNLTSRTQDLVLSNILRTIAHNRIAVAVIIASDTADKLFLAEVLRSYAPDVRLVTFEGDLLLAHPKYSSATHGMLVVSSNPMSEPDPLLPSPGGVELQFGSDITQGLFEATRTLFLESEPVPKEVWLSAVGRETLFPLERVVIDPGAEGACRELQAVTPPPRGKQPPPPRGWALLLSLVSLLVFFTLVEVVRRSGSDSPFLGIEWRQFTPRLRRAEVTSGAPAARIVQGLIVLIPVITAVPYLLLSGPYLSYLSREGAVAVATLVGDGVIVTLLVACPAALVITTSTLYGGLAQRTVRDLRSVWDAAPATAEANRWRELRRRGTAALGVALPLLGVTFVVLGLAGFVAWGYREVRFGEVADSAVVFFLNRSIALGSGVSPLLPLLLLLLVVVGWALASLWRHRTLGTLPARPGSAGSEAFPSVSRQLLEAIAEVRRAVDPTTFWILSYPLIWCLLALVPALYLSFYYGPAGPLVRGLEHGIFDWIATGLIAVGVALALGSGLSARHGWKFLRRWLDRLEALRLNPVGDAESTRWLDQLDELSATASRSRTALASGRRTAFDALRSAVDARGEAPASPGTVDDLVSRLRRPVERDAPKLPGLSIYTRTWLAIIGWADVRKDGAVPAARDADREEEPEVLSRARDFFVWQTAFFAREARAQLSQLLTFMTGALLFLLLAVTVYPFEPRRVLLFYFGSLVVIGIVHSSVIFLQIGRNGVMSRLTPGSPGAGGWTRSLLSRLALYGGIPLLGLLTSQVPELRQLLTTWIEPLLKTFL